MKIRSRQSKRKCQFKHATKRAWERYGIFISKADYEEACSRIQKVESNFIERQSNRITIHEIEVSGKIARVVYDAARKSIASFLPEGRLFKFNKKMFMIFPKEKHIFEVSK